MADLGLHPVCAAIKKLDDMRLGQVIADYRWANRIGVRELGQKIGIPHATLNRVERGEACDSDTLTKILGWLLSKNDDVRLPKPLEQTSR